MGTHPIFESDFDCLTDMTKIRIRLTNLHDCWLLSIGLSFFYGLLDKQCSLSFDKNASSQSSALYQRKLQSKLNLVAAMREEHEKIIASILSKSDQIHYGSYGTTLWTNFILSKWVIGSSQRKSRTAYLRLDAHSLSYRMRSMIV